MRKFTYSIFFVALLFLLPTNSRAQYCGQDAYIDHLEEQNPGIRNAIDLAYLQAISESKKASLNKLAPIDTVFVIPIVFHVVYNTEAQNISDELILEQLQTLNAAYNRENADTINTREIFKAIAGSTRIRFELAEVDPEGIATNGITRQETTRKTFNITGGSSQRDYVKLASQGGVAAWNTKKYFNIWICNLNNANGARSLFGYAYPPVNAEFWNEQYYRTDPYQGVVLHYEVIGTDNPSNLADNLYTNEKTAIHEVGHYLGLRHTWGDAGWGQNGCLIDDFIDDTPATARANSGCNYGLNTCALDNLPDQLENYMDYTSSVCTNMFTMEQIGVMRWNLYNLRQNLANSEYIEQARPALAKSSIYPNPFSESLTVYHDDANLERIFITLYDMLGRPVFTTDYIADKYITKISTDDVSIGVYYVEVISESQGLLIGSKLIKSH
jgi:Pregnancy-associated plasma protein-A/Secretion system C-terminal sorting domain